jgi:hypothetical protein
VTGIDLASFHALQRLLVLQANLIHKLGIDSEPLRMRGDQEGRRIVLARRRPPARSKHEIKYLPDWDDAPTTGGRYLCIAL